MKKAIIPILIAVFLLAGFIISIPFVNDNSARKVENELLAIPLPEGTEAVESLSKAGKLVGNGNGMQYFGAVLLKSTLSLEELSAYYKDKLSYGGVNEQRTQKIEVVDGTLSFKTEVKDREGYYIIYRFGEGVSPFSRLDLRGH